VVSFGTFFIDGSWRRQHLYVWELLCYCLRLFGRRADVVVVALGGGHVGIKCTGGGKLIMLFIISLVLKF
jgi:hypothetical protein